MAYIMYGWGEPEIILIKVVNENDEVGLLVGMSIDIKFHADIGGGHIETHSFCWFRKFQLLQHIINFNLKQRI
jgi:hypothetical protein